MRHFGHAWYPSSIASVMHYFPTICIHYYQREVYVYAGMDYTSDSGVEKSQVIWCVPVFAKINLPFGVICAHSLRVSIV